MRKFKIKKKKLSNDLEEIKNIHSVCLMRVQVKKCIVISSLSQYNIIYMHKTLLEVL